MEILGHGATTRCGFFTSKGKSTHPLPTPVHEHWGYLIE